MVFRVSVSYHGCGRATRKRRPRAGVGCYRCPSIFGVLGASALFLTACGGETPAADPTTPLPAVGLWTQPANAVSILGPQDLEASRPDVVWLADGVTKVVLRLEPPADSYLMFGYGEAEPKELVDPLRIAVSEELGVFVYDRGTERVDLYTPGGQYVRGFEPGFEPQAMYVTRRPFGLLFGVPDASTEEPVLRLVWTDPRGVERDTLLGPEAGPPALRGVRLRPGEVFVSPSASGGWAWSAAVPDTVYELTAPRAPIAARKLALGGARQLHGLLGDAALETLWLAEREGEGFRFEGYDVSGEGVLPGPERRTALRTTPARFVPLQIIRGVAIGWARAGERGETWVTAAYDLRPPGREPVRLGREGAAGP